MQGETRMDESKNGHLFIYKIYKAAQLITHLLLWAEYISYNKKQLKQSTKVI